MIRGSRFFRPYRWLGRRSLAALLSVLVAGPLVLSGCSQETSSIMTGAQQTGVPVTVGTAAKKDFPVQVRAIGTVEAFSTVTIKTLVAGQITKVAFREGQDVKRGDLLFEIDPVPFQVALQEAEATLAKDVALKDNAEKEAKRYALLIEKDLIPRQQYDQVIANLGALEATVKADAAQVEQSRVKLGYCFLRSPINGRTGDLSVNRGNIVKENDTKLVVINQVIPIYVTFSVPEQHLAEIRRHQAAGVLAVEAVLPGGEGGPIRGSLDFISNEVDKTTGTIQLKGKFANADRRLWPGQFVNVSLTLAVRRDAVLVPSQAIQTGQEGRYVFVIKPDLTAEMRPVTIGPFLGGDTVIEQGVQAGEQVVTDGQLGLVPGSKVDVKSPEAVREKAP
ncbi:MAG TPA: efflux RND transporter periplasmic adaptor subunit [Candidatus Deferrimicrobiaceae bacterium]|nr:efflux RND transporter periplasmic adaptor subunit [Candidatus Deferrimicrobiaceae bacterium]